MQYIASKMQSLDQFVARNARSRVKISYTLRQYNKARRYFFFKFYQIKNGKILSHLGHKQCVQMARLFFNLWPFTKSDKLPSGIQFAKVGSNLCEILNKLPKAFKKLSKVAIFVKKYLTIFLELILYLAKL